MSKSASKFQEKVMAIKFRGKEIFKPLNTGIIDECVKCVREFVANITTWFFHVSTFILQLQNRNCISVLPFLLVLLFSRHGHGQEEPWGTAFLSRCSPAGSTGTPGIGQSRTAGEVPAVDPAGKSAALYRCIFCSGADIEACSRFE